MTDFYIKEGDRHPVLTVTLIDENQDPVPLDAAIGVKLFMIKPSGTDPKIDGEAMTILTPADEGRVEYEWKDGDTDTPGDYDAEIEVQWNDGTKTTFPNFRFMRVKILKSIDTSD